MVSTVGTLSAIGQALRSSQGARGRARRGKELISLSAGIVGNVGATAKSSISPLDRNRTLTTWQQAARGVHT